MIDHEQAQHQDFYPATFQVTFFQPKPSCVTSSVIVDSLDQNPALPLQKWIFILHAED
jgi:hypothetical protein